MVQYGVGVLANWRCMLTSYPSFIYEFNYCDRKTQSLCLPFMLFVAPTQVKTAREGRCWA